VLEILRAAPPEPKSPPAGYDAALTFQNASMNFARALRWSM